MNNNVKEQLAALNQLDRKQGELYHRFAVRLGISDTAFWVLYSLCESDEIYTQNSLAELWCIPKQTINSAINVLVKAGYVQLAPIQKARNSKSIHLTEKGSEFYREMILPLFIAEQKAFSRLSETERDTAVALSEKHHLFLKEELGHLLECGKGGSE